jgi:probable phosphoglycerate mutase
MFGHLEQSPACINVLDIGADWIVRAVNTTPIDLAHRGSRLRTMEELWGEFRPPDGA